MLKRTSVLKKTSVPEKTNVPEKTSNFIPQIPTGLIWLSAVMLQLARFEWQFNWACWLLKPLLAMLILGITYFIVRRYAISKAGLIICLVLWLTAVISEVTFRNLGWGEPLELSIFELLLAVGIAGTFVDSILAKRTTVLVSIFLASFLFFINPSFPVAVAGAVFTLAVIISLLRTYWREIEGVEMDRVFVRGNRSAFAVPLLVIWVLAVLATGLSTVPVVTRFNSTYSPFSGGESWADMFAMSGVGDGQALVAATQTAQTEGPVDSDIFVESKKRSLYDIVSDEYGETKKSRKHTPMSSAVSLDTQKMQKNHLRLAQAEKNAATFTLCREAKGDRKIPDDLSSDALFLVNRQGPLVLKMSTYDTFDGQQWSHSKKTAQEIYSVLDSSKGDWFCLKRNPFREALRSAQRLSISIIHLQAEEVPTPPLLEAWSIRQINRRDFYGFSDEQLAMNIGNTVPEFTQVSMVRHGFVNPTQVTAVCNDQGKANVPIDSGWKEFQTQAEKNISDFPTLSWTQVEQVQKYLRDNFSLRERDDSVVSTDSAASPLTQFWETKSGQDYHFATAAVAMLRGLGFSARLAQGFYLSPESYDERSKKSAVFNRDIHTWVEVEVETGVWLPLEVTPGYLSTPESKTLIDHLVEATINLAGWFWHHPGAAFFMGMLSLVVWLQRKKFFAYWRWLEWQLRVLLFPAQAVRWTLNWSNASLPKSLLRDGYEPVGNWIQRVARLSGVPERIASAFLDSVNCELYSSRSVSLATIPGHRRSTACCLAWIQSLRVFKQKLPSNPMDLQETSRGNRFDTGVQ